jgi:hypothetical protein
MYYYSVEYELRFVSLKTIMYMHIYPLLLYTFYVLPGWNHPINTKAGGCSMSFYRLVPLLRRDAETVGQTLQTGDLSRARSAHTTRMERTLQDLLERYQDSEFSTTAFLKACSALYGPLP